MAFSLLEKAMCIILAHRGTITKRHFAVSAVLPYCFVLLLGVALLGVTLASVTLQAMAEESVHILGRDWSLGGVSGVLLYPTPWSAAFPRHCYGRSCATS